MRRRGGRLASRWQPLPDRNIYAREVKELNGQLVNSVLAAFPNVKDPGT